MTGPLSRSLAAWRDAHGFGILDILDPGGERFLVETRPMAHPTDSSAWSEMSERQLRTFLSGRGLSDVDAADAIQLAREWATTVSGPSVFPTPKNA